MTVADFDTSALVKLVVEELGSDDAAVLWDGADAVITSRVARAEVWAALAAAHRHGRRKEAILLASALALTGLPVIVASADLRLLRAARSAGLGTLGAPRLSGRQRRGGCDRASSRHRRC